MDGGAWWAAVHGVTEGQTRLSDFTFTFHFSLSCIEEGNGNPLQCFCLENRRDGGAWWAAVYGVAQSRTRLKRLSSRSSSSRSCYMPRPLSYMFPWAGGQGISRAPSTHRPLRPAQGSPALSGGLKLPFHLLPGELGLSPRLLCASGGRG